jgi:putative lipoic acid-binding regulatory protein
MTDEKTPSNETLLTFPCDFTIKVFGVASPEFEATVFDIIRKHIPIFSEQATKVRPSTNAKYNAMSITVHVESKDQLDRIYIDLSASPLVLMAL